jgi:hypothetical protein
MTNRTSLVKESKTLLAALLAVAGCLAEAPPDGESTDEASTRAALSTTWSPWTLLLESGSEVVMGSPGMCMLPDQGIVRLGRRQVTSTRGVFRLSLEKWRLTSSPAWADLGTREFVSKPACAALDELNVAAQWRSYQFVVFGRGTDNRFYAQTMLTDSTLGNWPYDLPTQPTVVAGWHQIHANTYTTAPATTWYYGWIVVVGRTGTRIDLLRTDALNIPNGWSAYTPVSAPPLPNGWTAVGDPAIATSITKGSAIITTRATSPGRSARIYQIYWDGWHGGSTFWNGTTKDFTETSADWTYLPGTSSTGVLGDPAITADYLTGNATVVMRGGTGSNENKIFQTTGVGASWDGWRLIEGTQTFAGTPAIGFGPFERCYAVIAKRTTENLLYKSTPPIGVYNCPQ